MSKKCCGSKAKSEGSLLTSKKVESKVVFLGESGVGKSSILVRYTRNEFSEAFDVTIGGAFIQTKVDLGGGNQVVLDIWDTAGQERFKSLMQMYYRQAAAAVVVYDVLDTSTFERCEYWVKTLKSQEPDCLLFLVGNKHDFQEATLNEQAVKDFAAANSMHWILTSAKLDINIKELFTKIAESIINKQLP